MAEPKSKVMRVVGIDWATKEENRALVELRLDIAQCRVAIERIGSPLTEHEVVQTVRNGAVSVVGVDVPFGWPTPFVQFIGKWSPRQHLAEAEFPARKHFSHRTTDLVVHQAVGKWPLSVSSDRIALGAFAWARLVAEHKLHERIDLGAEPPSSGGPSIIEVYPAATLAAVVQSNNVVIDGYKKNEKIRAALIESLVAQFKVEHSDEDVVTLVSSGEDSDKADAFVAALTAAAYAGALGLDVVRPSAEQVDVARREGWIFFPAVTPSPRRCYRARWMREKWAWVSRQNDGEAHGRGQDSISKPGEEGRRGRVLRGGPPPRVRVRPRQHA